MTDKLQAYRQLLRLPNLATAMADPLAGWFLVGGGLPGWHLPALLAVSVCLYAGGIVLNDCFDYRLDCTERPERPLPRGIIALRTGWTLGVTLLAAGLVVAAFIKPAVLILAGFLAGMILFYNAYAKHIPGLGPLVMGSCRFMNLLLGMRCAPASFWIAPVILGVYVAVLTGIARRENLKPELRRVVKNLLLGIIVLDALLVLAFTGNWQAALIVLALLLPAKLLSRTIAMT